MNLALTLVLITNIQITGYQSLKSQTDDSPFVTSTGEHVCRHGVAVSQDLLASGKIRYGDWLYIEGIGLKFVNDTMNPRIKNSIDIWVSSHGEEKDIWLKYRDKKVNIYKVEIIK